MNWNRTVNSFRMSNKKIMTPMIIAMISMEPIPSTRLFEPYLSMPIFSAYWFYSSFSSPVSHSYGMNSRKASALSSSRNTRVLWGMLISYTCMKNRNCTRFMMFQRNFKPKCRQICRLRRIIVMLMVVAATAVPNSSNSASLDIDSCGGISCLMILSALNWVPSIESTKMEVFLKVTINSSGVLISWVKL